ncbi:MAG: 16S rRNA (cytosine(967)-C(5))-methyltransferase RsmB [Clostridia bacterium]|nr:16S rRNA (cytosine(967)-C(5))-methyltransferase RsmB [Clostridia bacterium]
MNPARLLAVRSLVSIRKSARYANLELDAQIKKANLSERDTALFTALVYGVIEREITLDFYISSFCNRKGRSLSPFLRATLQCALYQLCYMDNVPARAVLYESAEIAKLSEQTAGAKLVTAVLHAFLRAKENDTDLFLSLSGTEKKSVHYSIPQWMIRLWKDGYGEEQTDEICQSFQTPADTCLHVNALKCDADTLCRQFREAGLNADIHPADEHLILLSGSHGDVRRLPGYDEGLFFAQDYSSARAAKALNAVPGTRVADICAAPGGKSFSLALSMQNLGVIYSSDLHASRVRLIDNGAKRLGINIIQTCTRDARESPKELIGTLDRVLCDVPCSGLGILAKKPDLRHKTEEEIRSLPKIQREILSGGALLLARGGRLVYSTCTLNPQENEHVVNDFLNDNSDFTLVEPPTTLFPKVGEWDGFFFAVLEKTR